MNTPMKNSLRDLVAGRVDRQWDAWAKDHPNLARVIDRTRLIESTTARLRDDPAFIEAMSRAGLDEQKLGEVGRVLELIERAVGRVVKW